MSKDGFNGILYLLAASRGFIHAMINKGAES